MRAIVSAIVLASLSSTAFADGAQFCVVDPVWGRKCDYFDAPSCQEAAQRVRGACVVNNQTNNSQSGRSVWDSFEQGARIGSAMGSRSTSPEPPPSVSSAGLGPIIEQFCRELQRQDIAELNAIQASPDTEDEFIRRLDIYTARSERCFAIVQAAR